MLLKVAVLWGRAEQPPVPQQGLPRSGGPGENSLGGLFSFSVGELFYPGEVGLKQIG